MSAAARRLACAALAALALALALAGCGGSGGHHASSGTTIAPDFMGMVSDDAFEAGPIDRRKILAGEKRTGVELLRQTFDWSQIEKDPGRLDFRAYDSFMTSVARARIRVMAVMIHAPKFLSAPARPGAHVTPTTIFPPRRNAAFATFARALVRRYGPGGQFWKGHPRLRPDPIHSWQVWNEPNLPVYWGGKPSAAGYVAMLRAVDAAIKHADRSAEVVSAGLPQSALGVPLLRYLREMYAHGALGTFDTLAIHPYALSAVGVLDAVRAARSLLISAGVPHVPIWVTEIGWASGGPPSSFTVGARRQASLVLATFTELARQAGALGIRGAVYYDWHDATPFAHGKDFWGLHTGLLTLRGSAKPALSAYFQAAGVVAKLR